VAADDKPDAPDSAAGLRMLEGYLYWQAETARAQQDAEQFADRLPWLTTSQRDDVIRLYRQERLETSRAFLDRIAQRVRGLQSEYADRYQYLKIRVLAASVATAAGLVAADALIHPLG
jgi:hypothetical protein